jgi:hypothetical protein
VSGGPYLASRRGPSSARRNPSFMISNTEVGISQFHLSITATSGWLVIASYQLHFAPSWEIAEIKSRMSSTRQAVIRLPKVLTGAGNRPARTPSHHVD